MRFTAHFESSTVGLDETALDALLRRVKQANAEAVGAGAAAIQGSAKRQMNGPGPKVISGRLRSSIMVTGPYAKDPFVQEAEIGPTVVYGRIQELGGRIGPLARPSRSGKHFPGMLGWGGAPGHREHFARSVTLPPRPYMGPGEEAARPTVAKLFYAAMARAVQGGQSEPSPPG